MKIIHHITMDMVQPQAMLSLDAVQGDGSTRQLLLELTENGKPWTVPDGVTAAVAFRKKDGTKGLYDTLPDGTKAVTISGNTVAAVLAPQVLSCAGEVSATVVFHDGKLNQLAAFPFSIWVRENPAGGQEISNDYYRYSTMEDVSEAVETALASLETEKQAFLAKAQEALQAVHDTATEDATAIVCEAFGENIAVADASDRPLKGLTICGKTVQNGTPTPENPVPLESAGAMGRIEVRVAGQADGPVQTLTAYAPGGLHSIGDVADEIDFTRGVRVQRVGKVFLDGVTANRMASGKNPLNGAYFVSTTDWGRKTGSNAIAICSHYTYSGTNVSSDYVTSGHFQLCYSPGNTTDLAPGSAYFGNDGLATAEEYNLWLAAQYEAGTPVTVSYILATPVETPLSAEELAQYAALHTNKPNTTVFNDSGAEMKLSYVADTKTYIDNKLAAISAAVLGA